MQHDLSSNTTAALRSLAQHHDLTMSVIVQGAWALLLHGYSGEREVVFGVRGSMRPNKLERAETIIGPLTNILPVRASLQPSVPVITLLENLQRQHLSRHE